MKIIPVEQVQGSYVAELDRYGDKRGFFQEVYACSRYGFQPKQINLSQSAKFVIRGLHVAPFAKLCMCVQGKLYDVVADVRPDSPTYLGWFGIWLSPESPKQLLVPAGCAHGFFAAEDNTMLLYMQGELYDPKVEQEVNWQDPQLAIDWPFADEYILSDKDRQAGFVNATAEKL